MACLFFNLGQVYNVMSVTFLLTLYCRLDWESSVLRGCSSMRRMEEDRLCQLRNLAEQYHQIMSDNRPKLVASSKRLTEPIQLCDISRDMEAVKRKVSVESHIIRSFIFRVFTPSKVSPNYNFKYPGNAGSPANLNNNLELHKITRNN